MGLDPNSLLFLPDFLSPPPPHPLLSSLLFIVGRPNTKQYIVHLSSVPSVLSYRGGVHGLRATATVDDEDDEYEDEEDVDDLDDENLVDGDAIVAAAAEEAAEEATGAAAGAAAGAASVTESFQNSSLYPSAVSTTTANAVHSTSAAVLTVQQLSARAARIMRSTPWGRLIRPDVRLPHVQAFTRFLEASHRSLLQSLKIPSSAFSTGEEEGKGIGRWRRVGGKEGEEGYTYLMNSFAAQLTASEARRLKLHPAVAEVERDRTVEVASVHSPEFLKLDSSLWPANGGQSNAGEGVIIGVIDSGIWPEHPSFSDLDFQPFQAILSSPPLLFSSPPLLPSSPPLLLSSSSSLRRDTSGVSYSTAPVRWRGVCSKTDDFTACSRKVVGARYFLKGAERAFGQVNTMDDYRSPRDMQQHGTWCAGAAAGVEVTKGGQTHGTASGMAWVLQKFHTYLLAITPLPSSLPLQSCWWKRRAAAGNAGVEVTVGGRTFGTASGMAPRARLAVYKALWMALDMKYGVKGKGSTSDLIAAAEKAVADGVDVISCSWGGLALLDSHNPCNILMLPILTLPFTPSRSNPPILTLPFSLHSHPPITTLPFSTSHSHPPILNLSLLFSPLILPLPFSPSHYHPPVITLPFPTAHSHPLIPTPTLPSHPHHPILTLSFPPPLSHLTLTIPFSPSHSHPHSPISPSPSHPHPLIPTPTLPSHPHHPILTLSFPPPPPPFHSHPHPSILTLTIPFSPSRFQLLIPTLPFSPPPSYSHPLISPLRFTPSHSHPHPPILTSLIFPSDSHSPILTLSFAPPIHTLPFSPFFFTLSRKDYTAVLTLGDGTTFTARIQSPFHSSPPSFSPCTTAPSLNILGRDYTAVLTLGNRTKFPRHLPIHPHRPPPLPTAPHRSTMGRDYTAVLNLGDGTTFTGRSLGGNTATASPLPLMLAGDYTTVGLPDDAYRCYRENLDATQVAGKFLVCTLFERTLSEVIADVDRLGAAAVLVLNATVTRETQYRVPFSKTPAIFLEKRLQWFIEEYIRAAGSPSPQLSSNLPPLFPPPPPPILYPLFPPISPLKPPIFIPLLPPRSLDRIPLPFPPLYSNPTLPLGRQISFPSLCPLVSCNVPLLPPFPLSLPLPLLPPLHSQSIFTPMLSTFTIYQSSTSHCLPLLPLFPIPSHHANAAPRQHFPLSLSRMIPMPPKSLTSPPPARRAAHSTRPRF
ncbi:unnamed protein product [Closterium sp. NIES-64]|nr:unnamed protein product [Closterium sp. NIES-64]